MPSNSFGSQVSLLVEVRGFLYGFYERRLLMEPPSTASSTDWAWRRGSFRDSPGPPRQRLYCSVAFYFSTNVGGPGAAGS